MHHTEGICERVCLVIGLIQVLALDLCCLLEGLAGFLACNASKLELEALTITSLTHLLHPERIGCGDELLCGCLVYHVRQSSSASMQCCKPYTSLAFRQRN
jgi:hypothetical protein